MKCEMRWVDRGAREVADFTKAGSRYSPVSARGINGNTFYDPSFPRPDIIQRCKADMNYFTVSL